ncbi:hypothetical protein ACKKBG_A31400 [Auxenochlorella protothecoides x Auxenochlorella symbiontica]
MANAQLSQKLGQALAQQFEKFANVVVETGHVHNDDQLQRILAGLKGATPDASETAFVDILRWRIGQLTNSPGGRTDALVSKRRMWTEIMFLDAAIQIAGDRGVLAEGQAKEIEILAFDWIINGEKHVDSRFPDLIPLRDRVMTKAAELLGVLSATSLDNITARFLKEVGSRLQADSASFIRQELLNLCNGLRFIRLRAGTSEELRASIAFLEAAHPLKHVASDKKSRVQQSICDMLSCILQPIVDGADAGSFGAGCDQGLIRRWFTVISVLRLDILKWTTKQAKQASAGLPLLTLLTCMETDKQMLANVDGMVDLLQRQLKDKKNAGVAALCICRCVCAYVLRFAGRWDGATVSKWVARATSLVLQNFSKGGLPGPEMQELVRMLCVNITKRLPEHGSALITDLLQYDGVNMNWEACMSGVSAILTLLAEVPARLAGANDPVHLPATAGELERLGGTAWLPENYDLDRLLPLIEQGYNCLDALSMGPALSALSVSLSKVIQQAHNLHGHSRFSTTNRSFGDVPGRERVGALPVFVAALQCLPFVVPSHWADGRLWEDLPAYAIHGDPAMRKVAVLVLHRCLTGLPSKRDQLVSSMASFCVRLPDDLPEAVEEVLGLLLALMRSWLQAAAGERGAAAGLTSLKAVEAAALALLCANSTQVRGLALQLARLTKDLHGLSTAAAEAEVYGGGGSVRPARSARRQVYVHDIFQEQGPAVVRECYWDIGRWSDIWRLWRPLPPGPLTLERCMRISQSNEDIFRWARIMCEIFKEAWARVQDVAQLAQIEIAIKLQALTVLDSAGRQSLPQEGRYAPTAVYCLALAAGPASVPDPPRETVFSKRDYVRLMVTSVRAGLDFHQSIAAMALGNVHPTCQSLVVQECMLLTEDYLVDRQMQRSISVSVPGMGRAHKLRRDDVRLTHAHIYRVLCANLPPMILQTNQMLRGKLVQFVAETARHINTLPELSPELQQLRHCLCTVARQCAMQLADALPQDFTADTRRTLFDMFSNYCEEGTPGQFRSELRRGVLLAKSKIKDPDLARQMEVDIQGASDNLEFSAYLGMATMLRGALFNADIRNPHGRILTWIDRMLAKPQTLQPGAQGRHCWGPDTHWVGCAALRNLLTSNPELAAVYVNRSYSKEPAVASGFFKVLAEVYGTMSGVLPLQRHILVSLVLHKVADADPGIRSAARSLLGIMRQHASVGEGKPAHEVEAPEESPDALVVVGALTVSQKAYQMSLSAQLAEQYTSIGEALAIEVLKRQLTNDTDSEALLCLCPWLARITLSTQWQGEWAEAFLNLLFETTTKRSSRHGYQIQQLWSTIAENRRNVVPVLEFLLNKSLQENHQKAELTTFRTGKQAALFLARIAPRQTIEHLTYELEKQIEEEHPSLDARTPSTPQTPKILEYQSTISSQKSEAMDQYLWRKSGRSEASSTSFAGESGVGRHTSLDEKKAGSENSRVYLTRAEVALILLSEVAIEQDEEFRPHLHVLLHAATLNSDSSSLLVRREAARLLVFLLYSLALKHLGPGADRRSGEYATLSSLIEALQAKDGEPLWQRERPTLVNPFIPSAAMVASFVNKVVRCFHFDTDLRERWWGEALKWACAAHSRHLASRSHQIFCALRPTLSSLSCNAMLAALQKCMINADLQKLDTAVEVLCTLKELLSNIEPAKFLLYPQLLLAAVSLLNSSVVKIGELTMAVLLEALQNLDLSDSFIRGSLLALSACSRPQEPVQAREPVQAGTRGQLARWELGENLFHDLGDADEACQLVCLQQLIIKGLFQPNTEIVALKVLGALAAQVAAEEESAAPLASAGECVSSTHLCDSSICSPVGDTLSAVLGDTLLGLVLTIAATLPSLHVHIAAGTHTADISCFVESLALACEAVGWPEVACAYMAVAQALQDPTSRDVSWAPALVRIVALRAFPAHGRWVLQRFVETVERGSEEYQAAGLLILRALFEVEELDLGSSFGEADQARFAGVLSPFICTSLGCWALHVMKAAVNKGARAAPAQQQDQDGPGVVLGWPHSIDELGTSNKLCSQSLERFVTACAGMDRNAMQVLPFIK